MYHFQVRSSLVQRVRPGKNPITDTPNSSAYVTRILAVGLNFEPLVYRSRSAHEQLEFAG